MAKVRGYKKPIGEKFLIYLALALMSTLYLLFVGACEKQATSSVKEEDEALYRIGQTQLRNNDYNAALKAFLRLIDEREDCPQSHLEAGRIYLSKLSDYVLAIYHLNKFIEMQRVLDPHSPLISTAKQMTETAKKSMILALPQNPYEDTSGLESAVAILKQENYELKQSIVSYLSTIKALEAKIATSMPTTSSPVNTRNSASQSRGGSTQATPQATSQASTPPTTRRIARSVEELRNPNVQRDVPDTYTVKAGDTLSTISRKVYGTQARWSDILRYNSSTLSSPEKLKVGQILRIPR